MKPRLTASSHPSTYAGTAGAHSETQKEIANANGLCLDRYRPRMHEPPESKMSNRPSTSPGSLEQLLAVVMRLPRLWLAILTAVALLSTLEVNHAAEHGWSVHFEVDAVTLGVMALIWLPALLRLLSLTGGTLKGAGMEVSSEGLMGSPEGLINDLTAIRTEAEQVTKQSPGVDAERLSRELQRQVDQMASEYLSAARAVDKEAIQRLSAEYEATRSRMPAGDVRTREMTRIVNEARVRASANRDAAARAAGELLRSEHEGERIIGLAFVQEAGGTHRMSDVLQRIENSTSAFEMFHALIALREIEPGLELHQTESAVQILKREKTDYRGVGVMQDAYLPSLIDDVIARLESLEQQSGTPSRPRDI